MHAHARTRQVQDKKGRQGVCGGGTEGFANLEKRRKRKDPRSRVSYCVWGWLTLGVMDERAGV